MGSKSQEGGFLKREKDDFINIIVILMTKMRCFDELKNLFSDLFYFSFASKTSGHLENQVFSKDENVEFMTHFSGIIDDLKTNERFKDIPDFTKRFARVLQYTVPNGKKVRGLTTLITYKMLEKPENLTKENIRLANILGWCVEMLEASILIIDDIVDNSDTRRNSTCWYKNQDVGNLAILDAVVLENSLQLLLKKYLSSHPFYVQMVELFIESNLSTAIGQLMDNNKYDLSEITMEQYLKITKFKTGYYTFWFPVTLGMYLSKAYDDDIHQEVTPILWEMGKFFQIQNDYNDCFGDPSITGKRGTDIQEGKCTWLSVLALQKAYSKQYNIMKKHFGKPDEKSVEKILVLYEELNLPKEMEVYEGQSFEKLCKEAGKITNATFVKLMYSLIEKLYKRERM